MSFSQQNLNEGRSPPAPWIMLCPQSQEFWENLSSPPISLCPGPALPRTVFPERCSCSFLGLTSHLWVTAGSVLFGKWEYVQVNCGRNYLGNSWRVTKAGDTFPFLEKRTLSLGSYRMFSLGHYRHHHLLFPLNSQILLPPPQGSG